MEIQRSGIKPDRVIIVSDNEVNTGNMWYGIQPVEKLADDTRKKVGKDFWCHGIDLMGYGTQQFKGPKTNIIAGWSEKVLDFIGLAEEGTGNLVKRISDYEW